MKCGCAKAYHPIGTGEFAEICGVSKQAVCNWMTRYPDFPKPFWKLAMGPVWLQWQARMWDLSRKEIFALESTIKQTKETLKQAKLNRKGVA